MTEKEIYMALTEIFHDVFLRDDLTLHALLSADDVEDWDSFKQIEIIVAVEEKFHVKMYTQELDQLRNVGDLVRVIASKLADR